MPLLPDFESFLPIGSLSQIEPKWFQQFHNHLSVGPAIVCNQNLIPRLPRDLTNHAIDDVRASIVDCIKLFAANVKREYASMSDLTFDLQIPPHQLYELAADRQS